MRQVFLVIALAAAPLALPAQIGTPSIVVTPNPAPPGTTRVQVVVTAPPGAPISYSQNAFGEVCDMLLFSSIQGASVFCGGVTICSATFVQLPAGQSAARNLTVCGTGDFAIRFRYRDAASTSRQEWVSFRIQGNPATEATLTTVQPPVIGAPFELALSAPALPNSIFLAALSFTSNVGIPLTSPTDLIPLDPDALLQFVLDPGLQLPGVFADFFSATDAAGDSPPIRTFVPNDPFLQGLPLKAAAVVFDITGPVVKTNQLNFRVGP